MSHKPRWNRNNNWANPLYWTTAAWNIAASEFYLNQIMNICMSRFRWVNLPPKVNTRYLEYTLMYQGAACIAWPENFAPENAFAMQAVTDSAPDANYDYPKWKALGQNGVQWECKAHVNGVMVWDSVTRQPIMPRLQFAASLLASQMRTKMCIMQHMRQPVLITAPREMSQQINNVISQTADGEPYIVGFDDFANVVQANVLQTASGQEAQSLTAVEGDMRETWNLVMSFLGIPQNSQKTERQTTSEILQTDVPSDVTALASLDARRAACRALNELTGGDANVVWNVDVESNTFNTINDMQRILASGAAASLAQGAVKGEGDGNVNVG